MSDKRKPLILKSRRNRDRTCDLSLVRAALSQLSYPPETASKNRFIIRVLSKKINKSSKPVMHRGGEFLHESFISNPFTL